MFNDEGPELTPYIRTKEEGSEMSKTWQRGVSCTSCHVLFIAFHFSLEIEDIKVFMKKSRQSCSFFN